MSGLLITHLPEGFARAVSPISTGAISTPTDGLIAGEVAIPTGDGEIPAYRAMPDMAAVEAELARTTRLQEEIWRRAVAACGEPGVAPSTSTLVLPALNAMIDIVTTRTVAAQTHQPVVIFAMLFALMLVGALLVGYGMSGVPSRNWVHMIGFALAVTVVMYVILDLEFPRVGLIRLDRFDRLLEELRPTMK